MTRLPGYHPIDSAIPEARPAAANADLARRIGSVERDLSISTSFGSFSAVRSTSFAISGITAVVFNTEEWDYSNSFDMTTGRFVPPLPGLWRLSFTWTSVENVASGTLARAYIYKNGVLYREGSWSHASSLNPTGQTINSLVLCTTPNSDYFDFRAYCSAAVNVTGWANGELVGQP